MLGANPERREDINWAFLFLLTRHYRTVYVNDVNAAVDTAEHAYEALCTLYPDYPPIENVAKFCELVPTLPTNLDFQYMGRTAKALSADTGALPNVDIYVIRPDPEWFFKSAPDSTLCQLVVKAATEPSLGITLGALLGENSQAFVLSGSTLMHSAGIFDTRDLKLVNPGNTDADRYYVPESIQILNRGIPGWNFHNPILNTEVLILSNMYDDAAMKKLYFYHFTAKALPPIDPD